jgi:cytoplasmic FMR1 interacting protein
VACDEQVSRPLRKAHKRNRPVKEVMMAMRDVAGDWLDRNKNIEDFKNKKEVLINLNRDFPRRFTGPTHTQVVLLRRMMHTIFHKDAPGMQGGLFTDKDLKKEWIPVWEKFYADSYYYPYLLDFSKTLRETIDLSHLWFREFYLEMTKCVQFPIGMWCAVLCFCVVIR